jgi:hypothetical protein
MGVILILSFVLAIIAVLILAALLIPTNISLRLFKEGPRAQVGLYVGFLKGAASGRIDFSTEEREFQLNVLGITFLRTGLENEKKGENQKKKKKRTTDWKRLAVNANELFTAGKDFAGALAKNVAIKSFGGRVKVGLSDPAQTGMLAGFLYAGGGIAKAFLPETDFAIEPSFEGEQMDAELELALSLPLFKIIIPLIRFFRSARKIF